MVGVEKEEGEERVGRPVSRKKRRSWEEVNKITGVKKKFYVRKEKKKKGSEGGVRTQEGEI